MSLIGVFILVCSWHKRSTFIVSPYKVGNFFTLCFSGLILLILGESFDVLLAYFEVERTFTFFLNKAYIPTMLLVFFNLGSYWIPDQAVPARVSLIITTFLSSMFILMSIMDETVKVSYITSMQIFMIVNISFLMTAIIQFLTILHLRSKKVKVSNTSFNN